MLGIFFYGRVNDDPIDVIVTNLNVPSDIK